MLVGVFCVQAFNVFYSYTKCADIAERRDVLPLEVCPDIGDRFDSTTNLMIATVLSLLVGNKLADK